MNIADLHFLVAEDHEFQRKTLIIALKSLGAKHILEAADGRVAFELFSDLAGRHRKAGDAEKIARTD